MTEIILRDKASNYYYLLDRDHRDFIKYLNGQLERLYKVNDTEKKQLIDLGVMGKSCEDQCKDKLDVEGDEIVLPPREQLIIACLAQIEKVFSEEEKKELFNIVRIMTIIDSIYHKFYSAGSEPHLARIFVNEACRLMLTLYSIDQKDRYSACDLGSLQRLAAQPSISGRKIRIQQNYILEAVHRYWPVECPDLFPLNFEYINIGNYQNLKNKFYDQTKVHDKFFSEAASFLEKRMTLQNDPLPETSIAPPDPGLLLSFCQFFDIAWPLAFFIPFIGWAYLGGRLLNAGERLTTEKYSFFSCSSLAEPIEELPLDWNLQGCFAP